MQKRLVTIKIFEGEMIVYSDLMHSIQFTGKRLQEVKIIAKNLV